MRYKFGEYPKPLFERTFHNDPFFLEDLRIYREIEHAEGKSLTCQEVCINQYGQNIAFPELKAAYPTEVKLLEDIFNTEKPISNAMRTGEIINGNAAIVLTYDVNKNHLTDSGITDPNIYHAQTRMMAAQLDEALLGHCVNICATFQSGSAGLDEFCAVVSADRIPSDKRADFEKEFDAVLDHLALSKDIVWVKRQYDTFVRELDEKSNNVPSLSLALKAGCSVSDIAIEACGFLGQKIGGRQFMFDKARFSHNMEQAQKLAESLDVSKDSGQFSGLLYSCLHNGASRAQYNGQKKVTLYTKNPLDSLYSPSIDSFQISKNELRSILSEMGYDNDFPVCAFLSSYSCETAAEVKTVYEDRNRKPLDKLLNDAKHKQSSSEHKTSVQKNEQEYDL